MCTFLSGIVLRNGDVLTHEATDSHEMLIEHFGLSAADRSECWHFVRVEFYPCGGAYSNPDSYILKVDDNQVPPWWDDIKPMAEQTLRDRISRMIVRDAKRKVLLGGCWIVDTDTPGIRCVNARVFVVRAPRVYAFGSSRILALNTSAIEAYGQSYVEAKDGAHVFACESSHVEAFDCSRITACGTSMVVCLDQSLVKARSASHVLAYGSAEVEAFDTAFIEALDHSKVTARGCSRVIAAGWAQVLALESSHVTHAGYTESNLERQNHQI